MKKVLFAIDNQKAERKLSELIRDANTNEEYQVVGTPVSNESVTDFLQNKTADILVYMEGLGGKEDGFDYVLKLHKKYPHIRIVFIAGQRSVGDKKLAMLVAFHIYDIVSGQKILMPDVAKRILNPASFEDVIHYLPDVSGDLFRDSDFGAGNTTVRNAQDESDRIAEKASVHKQLADAKASVKSLSVRLDAAEAHGRRLEEEKARWETAAGKERMLLERKFDEDRKILCAQIEDLKRKIEQLGSEKLDLERKRQQLVSQLDQVKSDLDQTQIQSCATVKALRLEIEDLKKQHEKLTAEYTACKAELDSLNHKIKTQKNAITAAAKTEADKILAEANALLEQANERLAEAEAQKALYFDKTFEEYKATEIKKIEDAKTASEAQIAKDLERAKTEKQKRIDELDALIHEKEAIAAVREEELAKEYEESKRVKTAELEGIDAVHAKKRAELDILDKSIVQKKAELSATQDMVNMTRKENEAQLQALDEDLKAKIAEAQKKSDAEVTQIVSDARRKSRNEMESIEAAFGAERKRLAKDFDAYKQELQAEKRRLAEGQPNTYRYDESDFIVNGQRNARCKIMMFYSPTAGSGNSTVALNVATYLAKKGQKTIYVELNWQNPTMKDNLGIAMMRSTLEEAFKGVCAREYGKIDKQIITKQQVLNLKTQAREVQMKYPDMLSFLSYTKDAGSVTIPTVEMVKGLIAYLKYRKNYINVVIDLPSHVSEEMLRECYAISNRHVITMCQDIVSMYTVSNRKTMLADLPVEHGLNDATYVINKYVDGTVLGSKKISDVCGMRNVVVIPQDMDGMLLAAYKSVPAILISKNRQVVAGYKDIGESLV